MSETRHPSKRGGRAMALAVMLAGALVAPGAAAEVGPCLTIADLEAETAVGANSIVPRMPSALTIIIRPEQPRVGRPVVAWIEGHQPGRPFVARRVSWSFNNAVSLLKSDKGGSASSVYLTPGQQIISVSVTDMAGQRKTSRCSFQVKLQTRQTLNTSNSKHVTL